MDPCPSYGRHHDVVLVRYLESCSCCQGVASHLSNGPGYFQWALGDASYDNLLLVGCWDHPERPEDMP
jgi:hypothetical protein